MKNFLLLLFALLIVVVFGGTAFFYWDVSKGARFERLDQSQSEGPLSGDEQNSGSRQPANQSPDSTIK